MHRQRLLPLTAETLVLVQQVRGKYKIIVLVTCPGDFAVTLYYVLNSISCHCIVMATSVLLDARKIFIFWNSHCSYLPVRMKGISAFYLRTAVSLSFLRNMSRRHDPHSPSSPALFLPQWQQEMVMRDSMLAWLLPFLSSFFLLLFLNVLILSVSCSTKEFMCSIPGSASCGQGLKEAGSSVLGLPGAAGRRLLELGSCLWATARPVLAQVQHVWAIHLSCSWVLKSPQMFLSVQTVRVAACHNFRISQSPFYYA